MDLDDLPRTPSPLMSPSSVLSSDISRETDMESPYSPADNKWHSAIYEDSVVLTCGHEAYDGKFAMMMQRVVSVSGCEWLRRCSPFEILA